MRASSLSSPKVVELLNGYFVPVYINNRDCDEKAGTASKEEKAARARVFREAFAGTVCVYILGPDGKTIDTSVVSKSYNVDVLVPMLQKTIDRLKVARGETLVKPKPQSRPPASDADALVLHLTARYLQRKGSSLEPLPTAYLGTKKAGNWSDIPSENWIVLPGKEWRKLLPEGELRPGTTWDPDKEAAARILHHCYPPTEENDIGRNKIESLSLKGKVLSVENGIARARLDGSLKMKHPFYPRRADNKSVQATLAGIVEFVQEKKQIRSFQLVTDEATYGNQPFGVAIRLR